MSKEDSGRLFSKVAKFVRNPLKDWAELDAQDSAVGDNGYSREMLREMLERRQRNDSVRRREFDVLRRLRQREAAGIREPEALSSQNDSGVSGKTDGRAVTLRKIDEIEAQMSRQWWKGEPGGPDAVAPGKEVLAAQRSRAYADTTPGLQPDNHLSAAPKAAPPHMPEPGRMMLPAGDSALDEAAIRFAHGDDGGAESILLQALVADSPLAGHDETWLGLLDLYRATGDAEKFGAASARYAQRFGRRGPDWVSLRTLAVDAEAASGSSSPARAAADSHAADWRSPPQLRRADLAELTRALTAAGSTWTLDWRLLASIDADAAGPLRMLFAHWANSPVDLRFAGASRLESVLEKSTPVNEREIEQSWWQLRMAALRVMHAPDAFEMAALNYCITYEVSPPAWEEPCGRITPLQESQGAPAGVSPTASVLRHASLSGELGGETPATWRRLEMEIADLELAGAPNATAISCAALIRIDLAAAEALVHWVTTLKARGQQVQFLDVQRLVATFLGIVGLTEHAPIALRQD
ncbi:MAG: STAS domain-containing protein [Janthinobacterium lividum]